MSETEPFAVAAEVPAPNPPVSSEGGGTAAPDTPAKPRSGFARQKLKVARLTELYENVLCDYERLLADHHNLERDYAKLESAFNEVAELNTALAGELQRMKAQHRPVRYGMGLMGV